MKLPGFLDRLWKERVLRKRACLGCGKPLTNRVSVSRGFGAQCWRAVFRQDPRQMKFEDIEGPGLRNTGSKAPS